MNSPKEDLPMTLEKARAILRAEDATDSARALEAIAMVLRFEGISTPRLLSLVADLEQISAEIKAGVSR